MSEATAGLAHQFDDREQQKDASTLGMWLFLVTEILFFGGMFTVYVVYRSMYLEGFLEGSHHLDVTLGAVNTVILIVSSLTMAFAVHAAQLGKRGVLIAFLILTIIFGGAFLGIKGVEYSHKFHESLVPGPGFHFDGPHTNGAELFFSIYFAMTGMHALHMVIGVGLLLTLILQARKGRYSRDYYNPVEITGLYWHFVDIVWIFLFPLLYLLGRH